MQHPDPIHDGATCEALDFHPFGPDRPADHLPNVSAMGIVTLAEDGTFISSRVFSEDELAAAWAEHRARHGRA